MQAVAEKASVVPSPKVLYFRTRMGVPASNPLQEPQKEGQSGGHDPVVHGSKAAIAAAVFAGLAMLASFAMLYVNWSNRSDQKNQQATQIADEHTNLLIDNKLNPAVEAVNEHTDEKISELSRQIQALDVRIARLEGPLTKRVSTLEDKADSQQQFLDAVLNPGGSLAAIQKQLQAAEQNRQILPQYQLANYKNILRVLPPALAGNDYWITMAAVINYQSYINQLSGQAPDPARVSRPCPLVGNFNSDLNFGNVVEGGVVSECLVDLGIVNAFENVTFKDSVIRYQGGPVAARNVRFINCRFILDLKNIHSPATYKPTELLMALLNTDQKHIYVR